MGNIDNILFFGVEGCFTQWNGVKAMRHRVKRRLFEHTLHIACTHIVFLTKCQRRRIFPSFICFNKKVSTSAGKCGLEKGRRAWLRAKIKEKHKQLMATEIDLYSLHLKLLKTHNVHSPVECIRLNCAKSRSSNCWETFRKKTETKINRRRSIPNESETINH